MSTINKSPYFSGLQETQLSEIESITHQRKYKKDEIIFFEGEPGNHIFLIDRGKVKLVKMVENGDEQILNIFKKGDFFAEVVIFDQDNYPATAISLEDSTLALINSRKFKKILKTNPDISFNILKVMSNRLRRAQKNVRDLGLKNCTNRLAGILIYLAEKHGEKSGNKIVISLSLTQQELASMIGTSRETVSRILKKFENQGLISTSRKQITIYRLEELKSLS